MSAPFSGAGLRIRTKLLLISLGVGFPVVLTVGFLLNAQYWSDYRRGAQSVQVAAEAIAHHQQSASVEGIRTLLVAIAQLDEVKRRDPAACARVLRDIRENNRYGQLESFNIGLADPQGRIVASGLTGAGAPFVVGDRKYFLDAVASRRFSVGEYALARTTHRPVLHFALPVLGEDGEVRSVLYTAVDLAYFDGVFRTQKMPPGTVLNISDHRGTLLYRYPEHPVVKPGTPDRADLRSRMTGAAEDGIFEAAGRDGIPRVLAFKRLRLSPGDPPYMYIRVSIPKSEVTAVLVHNLWIAGSLILATGLLALLLAHVLGRRLLTDPVERLARTAQALEGGDLSARTGLSRGGGEIGVLAQSFDAMAGSLEQRMRERDAAEAQRRRADEELRELNATLEEKVHMRTAQLEAANHALEEARREAESSNHAKSAFLAAMSHEIRTPMNAVLNMIATVLESPLGGEQREYLQVADASARHLLSVINDILDFSKIESGKLEIEDIPFSLHGLLEGVADLFRARVAESHVELVLEIVPGTPDGVRGDPTRLRQVLVNLVGNAFKFTARGQVVLHAEAEGGELRLSVADSGIGISQEQHARLFQPFVQADTATTRRFGGTGLGLTISRRLAQLMGGGITLSSVVGEGSLFTVTLPLRADAAGNRGESHLPPSLEGRGVLLVEDNTASREAMRVMFAQHGLKCVPFPAVEPAVAWLKSPAASDIGAAVVDWSLAAGGMDGLAGIVELRRVRAGLPCFLISAFADSQVQERAKASGAAAFIPKPVTWGAVHAALQRAMGGAAEPAPAPAPSADPFAGTLALLAEDNPQNQLVAKILLKKMGVTVEVAGNGKAALEMARANPGKYQVILMDMQMPEMDGLEATRRIRALGAQEPALKTVPIIAMTANAMKSDLDACLAAGMDGFVTKPIDKKYLQEALKKALHGEG